ncbi:BA75_05188T0 [Komagataella pastoris]|uniref:Ras modification protein ERF4 n=1 Tax=Komagataella pastoris TaxID=4922 RepID=A0A1B2JH27_PICPA|nr:BA75_05188T0 [Komagataella pastoris]
MTLFFYNYHEFSIYDYKKIGEPTVRAHDKPLIITHFDNPYISLLSTGRGTRIVRVPRVHDVPGDSCIRFSTVLPGEEPAAIRADEQTDKEHASEAQPFTIDGIYEEHGYGITSHSPLSNIFTDEEFQKVVTEINRLLKAKRNWWMEKLSIFAFGILSFYTQTSVDDYVIQKNREWEEKNIDARIIPPSWNGYLSLDFEILDPMSIAVGSDSKNER